MTNATDVQLEPGSKTTEFSLAKIQMICSQIFSFFCLLIGGAGWLMQIASTQDAVIVMGLGGGVGQIASAWSAKSYGDQRTERKSSMATGGATK